MGVPDPCCGMSLQKATKILAIIEIIFALVVLLLGVLGLAAILALSDEEIKQENLSKGAVVAAVVVFLIVGFIEVIIAVILLMGSNQRDLVKCRIWFIIAVVLMVLTLASLISEIAGRGQGGQISSSVISLIYRGYLCWVVLAFMAELKGVNVPTF